MYFIAIEDVETDSELSPPSDYFVTTDNTIPEKKILASYFLQKLLSELQDHNVQYVSVIH